MRLPTLLTLTAAALALVPATASAHLRVLETGITVEHADDWQYDGASGRQAFSIATRKPAREAIDHLGAHPPHGAPPFTWMSSEDLTWHPPRGELRRSAGGLDCAVTRPRVRMHFRVESRGGSGGGPFDLELIVGGVPLLDSPCGDAGAAPALATPPAITLPRGIRKVRRLERGRSVELRTRIERGIGPDGRILDSCAERPATGPWECSTTTATVKLRRVV